MDVPISTLPTEKQLHFLKELMIQTGEWVTPDELFQFSKQQASEKIEELKRVQQALRSKEHQRYLHLPIEKPLLIEAIRRTVKYVLSGKLYQNNLRNRGLLIQFENYLRGVLCELRVKQYLEENGLWVTSGTFNGKSDIDIIVDYIWTLEIKISNLPEQDTLDTAWKRDIKIRKRSDDLNTELDKDYYVQCFIDRNTKECDAHFEGLLSHLFQTNDAKLQKDYFEHTLRTSTEEEIISLFQLDYLLNSMYFYSWVSRHAEKTFLSNLDNYQMKKTWETVFENGSTQTFWRAPMQAVGQAPHLFLNQFQINNV